MRETRAGLRWGIDWVTCRDLETLWEFLGWGLEIMKKSFTKNKEKIIFFVTIAAWHNVIGGKVYSVKKKYYSLGLVSSSLRPVEMMTCIYF